LFSNPQMAAFINRYFEPAWESVRPVPIVRIDFGDGRVITRTLHGNIATYVCTAGRQVLDILPGIHAPAAYRDALDQLRTLAANAASLSGPQRDRMLRVYHEQRANALEKGQEPARLLAMAAIAYVGKGRIERPVELVLLPGAGPNVRAAQSAVSATPRNTVPAVVKDAVPVAGADLASWKALVEDTRLNERARRLLIHRKLGPSDAVAPEQVCKWLYKEVLHADLDDPYLGLGDVLVGSDPFRTEKTR
jgi:hypothetical protein